MNLIDIHSHLQFSDFDSNRDQILREMKDYDVATIVVGTNAETSQSGIDLMQQYPGIIVGTTVGHHPCDQSEFDTAIYRSMLDNNQGSVVAVGECGLDYFRTPRDQVYDRQLQIFRQQIELAIDNNLTLVLHGRPTPGTMNAYQDMIGLLREYRRDWIIDNPGNVHFFVGSVDIVRQFIDLGFTVSFDGPITFAKEYDEVIKYVPSDMIHAETDAPYAAPVPHRGKQNRPTFVQHVVDSLIKIRGEKDHDEFRNQLLKNAQRVFKI